MPEVDPLRFPTLARALEVAQSEEEVFCRGAPCLVAQPKTEGIKYQTRKEAIAGPLAPVFLEL